LFSLVLASLVFPLLLAGCGGNSKGASSPVSGSSSRASAPSSSSIHSPGAPRTGTAFVLNESQPVPKSFKLAYGRKEPIVVLFYEKGQNPFYPQGLAVDSAVRSYLESLEGRYRGIGYFAYDINDPQGYGSLAAQLGIGYTPSVTLLAPSGGHYVIRGVYTGYVPRSLLAQALYDLSASRGA